MLRLIGLVVIVLLILSLAHGERTGMAYNRMNARADTLVDALTGALADGVRAFGDAVFGPADPEMADSGQMRDLAHNLDGLARSANVGSRRALAQMVLRSCPSLGLVCQPASGETPLDQQAGQGRRRGTADDLR
jgi:hypothetical protein